MSLGKVVYVLRRQVANRGVAGAAKNIAATLLARLSPKSEKEYSKVHPFDIAHGVDTSGFVTARDLPSGHRNDIYRSHYYGASPSLVRGICEALELDLPRFSFVDIGSGKGRVLLLASHLPFREIVGVELSPELSAVAERNIEAYRSPERLCTAVSAVTADAGSFAFPPTPLVLFLYHPFGPPVLEAMLRNLQNSLREQPRDVYMLYLCPEHQPILAKSPSLERLWEREFALSDEDYAAYAFPTRVERCALFRVRAAA